MGHPPKFFHAITTELPGEKGEFTSFESKIGLCPLLYNRGGGFRAIENKADQLDLFDDFAFGFEEILEGGISSVYQPGRDIVRVQMAGADPLSYQIGGLAPPTSPVTVEGVKSYRDGSTMVDYEDFMPGADLRITLGGHVIAKQVLLKVGHPRHLVFRIFTDQIAEQIGDSLTFGENWRMVLPYFLWDDPEKERPANSPPALETELRRKSRDKWFDRDYYELIVEIPPGNWAGWSIDPTVIWQPGASGKDAWAREANPGVNYGNNVSIYVGAEGVIPNNEMNRSFIEFDLASAIPSGSTILSMSMRLWTSGVVKWPWETHSVHRCTAAWGEGTLTWNLQPAVAGAVMSGPIPPADPVTFNFNLAQAILMYQTNNGLRIHKSSAPEDEQNCNNNYQSSDHATANQRPELTITYIPPAYRRLAAYTLNVWKEPEFLDQQGRIVPPNEIRPDNWLDLEGIEPPGSRVYDSFVEDPTKIRIVESEYQDGKPVPRIKSDRSQFGEIITARAAGGQM